MNRGVIRLIAMPLAIVFATGLLGCASNISHIAEQPTAVEKKATYSAPVEKVWGAAQRALSEDETIKISDKSSGIIVTEFRPIDAKELSLAQT